MFVSCLGLPPTHSPIIPIKHIITTLALTRVSAFLASELKRLKPALLCALDIVAIITRHPRRGCHLRKFHGP